MRPLRVLKFMLVMLAVGAAVVAAYWTREKWQPWLTPNQFGESAHAPEEPAAPADRVVLSDQAVTNLTLTAKALKPSNYWKTIAVPGMIVDRPGQGDRSIVAPITGVVQSIEHVPGDAVRPGDVLFRLQILSETLHQTQTELYKSVQDIKLSQSVRTRMAASAGVIPEIKLIEADNQIARLEIAAKAYRQELITRGLTSEQIASVAEGKFLSEIEIAVPTRPMAPKPSPIKLAGQIVSEARPPEPAYEVQELKVELGQQVQAGQTLGLLANHHALMIEGRAFRDETPLLERAAREGWLIQVDFQEPPGSDWPEITQSFQIEQLGSTIDPVNRTFSFLIPLENQSRSLERNGRTQRLWRFRPGQKVRLHVPVEKLENVFVLPADAVTFDGPEAYTFTQNVNTYVRRPIRVLLRDRHQVVVANDSAIVPGSFAVQGGAAQLNRMVKSQSSAAPKGFHIHADGTVHKNDEKE